MSYTPEDRISRKDAAALARKSPDTIRRAEKRHQIEVRPDPLTGEATYRVADLLAHDLIKITDLGIAGTAAESAEVIKSRGTITDLRAEIAETQGRLVSSDAVIATLREQLASAERQLGSARQQLQAKDRQLAELTIQLGKLADVIARLGGRA
ncbi:hypothetical protein GCM10028801_43570 [Nocardioides maradonensis]